MSRVSRRKNYCIKDKVALYVRISVDDETDTVNNQIELLRNYAINNNYDIYKEYLDIGRSGTNFNRKGFEEMLVDAKLKLFKIIIVKDLSRLGRNYIETGEYIEKIFPSLGIRFIAIMDKYDSFDYKVSSKVFDYTIKNLVNEVYAYDISKKVKSSISIKQNGKKAYSLSVVPYGYKRKEVTDKEKSDEYIYDIDNKVAWVVKTIYKMYLIDKYTITDITRWLDLKKINPPMIYSRTGLICSSYNDEYKKWNKSTVLRILNNKIYYGIMEVNKYTTDFYNDKRKIEIDINERKYFYNVVKPIIDF